MTNTVILIIEYQLHILAFLGAVALFSLFSLWRARAYLSRTPFGLEREVALRRQNGALFMLTLVVILAITVYMLEDFIVSQLLAPPNATPTVPAPTPTASPVAGPQVVVDSSGCENANATLTEPEPGERIAGSFEVRGTANIDNFAFYKFEIAGAGTRGEWLSLGVGTTPVVDGVLGSFDASARDPGQYAFRLVVLDNTGGFPPPCVVPITIAGTTLP